MGREEERVKMMNESDVAVGGEGKKGGKGEELR